MNLIWLTTLIRLSRENRERIREDEKRIANAYKKKFAPESSNRPSYSPKVYDETEYFNMVVTENPALITFFKELEGKGKEIDDIDAEEVRKVIEEKLKLQAGRAEKIDKVFEEIKASGLDININEHFEHVTVGEKVLNAGIPAFGEKGEYAENTRMFALDYKGILLYGEWFKGDKKKENPFDVEYNAWLEQNKDLEKEIIALEKEIKKQERKVKHAIFGKEDKENDLKVLIRDLECLKEKKSTGKELKRKRDAFAEITPKQKDQLEKYFELVDECKEKGKELDTDIREYEEIKGINANYYDRKKNEEERNKWQRATDALREDGEVSDELLDAIDTIISEGNIGHKKYDEGKDSYAMKMEGYSREFTNALAWYLGVRRENIVTKALHRKEEAYKTLSAEHKKICEMVGLVAEAEKIEGDLTDKKGDDAHEEHGKDE